MYAFPAGLPATFLPASNAAGIAELRAILAEQERRIENCEHRDGLVLDGLKAAFEAAGWTGPHQKPHLTVVRNPATLP